MLALTENTQAQVQWKDRPFTLAEDDQKNHSITRPSNDSITVVVWEDYRSGESDIYAQMIENKNGITVWFPIDGVPVCTANGEQRNPRAVFDSLGGVIITWEDYRNDQQQFDPVHSLSEIYANRIFLSNGEQDPSWNGGILISGATLSLTRSPRLVGTGEGAVITWTDYRNASRIQSPPYYTNLDVYANAILYTGALKWASEINVAVQTNDDQRNPEIVLDSIYNPATNTTRGVVISYEDNRVGYWQIFADRFDANGNRIWGDLHIAPPPGGSANNPHQLNHRMVSAVVDGTGGGFGSGSGHRGVIITWQDERNRNTTGVDIYAQRIDIEAQSGQPLWPSTGNPNGQQVTNAAEDQVNPKIDVNALYAVIAWEDYTSGNDWDVFANQVDASTGAVNSASGTSICSEQNDQINIDVEFADDRFTLVWQDHRTGAGADIYTQEVEKYQLSFYWPSNGQLVTQANTDQISPEVGHRVFVFTDDRRDPISADNNDDANVYAQKIGDECDLPTEMHYKDVLAKWTLGTDASDHRFVVDEEGNSYVVWYEDRNIPLYAINQPGIYVQKIDKYGVPRWKNGGILVSDSTLPSGKPDVCIDDAGGAIVTYHEEYNSLYRIVVKRIDVDGAVAWTVYPPIPTDEGMNPRIVEDDASGCYVAYEDVGNDIFVYAISNGGSGGPLHDIDPDDQSFFEKPMIVKDNLGGYYVMGVSYLNGTYWVGITRGHLSHTLLPPLGTLTNLFGYSGFGGYDIATDVIERAGIFDGFVVVSDGNGIYSCRIAHYTDMSGQSHTHPSDEFLVSGSVPPNVKHTLPTIDADSLSGQLGGGAIFSYNVSKYFPQSQTTMHGVETNRILWGQGMFGQPVLGLMWGTAIPFPALGLSLNEGSTIPTEPRIIKRSKRSPALNSNNELPVYGVVTWKDDGYSSCTDVAALAMEIDYNLPNSSPHQPIRWQTYAEISPNIATLQGVPIIQRSTGDSLSLFWLDNRTGSVSVIGTSISSDNSQVLRLKDRNPQVKPVASFQIRQGYPNPLSLTWGRHASVEFAIPEGGVVVMRIFDILGREVVPSVSSFYERGIHYVELPLVHVLPGTYFYSLQWQNERITRAITITK